MKCEHGETIEGDCLEVMRGLADNSVDLVFCSPPYEAARTYGIGFKLRGEEWVEWAKPRFLECLRVSRGLVAWVVEGQTRDYRYSAAPLLLMADLHRAGVRLRKPPVFNRVGIPGSGGPDWLRNDYEFCVCASGGKLPWSDNTAMGKPPKWAPGGEPSHRTKSGRRVRRTHPKRDADGTKNVQGYNPPKIANPGNVISCLVGGGRIGSKLAHENEAPFPEYLAEFFIKSFCPVGGVVLDCFSGSGTTAAVAVKTGRRFLAIDCRAEMVDLTKRRVEEVTT